MKSAPIVKGTVMMVSVLGEREERPVSGQSCVIGKSIKTFTSNAIHPKNIHQTMNRLYKLLAS
jgi:hypothetical protein